MVPLSESPWSGVAVATTAILGVFAIVGILVRVLVIYLRSELIEPTLETNRQITGTTEAEPDVGPTFREHIETKLDEVGRRVDSVSGEVTDAAAELSAMAMMFDGHLEWSQEEVDRLWAALKRQRDRDEDTS